MNKKGFTLIELLVVIAIIAILGSLLLFGLKGCSRSNGSRVGVVQKFAEKGIVWNTQEGELNTGGAPKDGGAIVGNVWEFSVEKGNKEIIDAIDKAMSDGGRYRLYYKQSLWIPWWTAGTNYLVWKVEKVGTQTLEAENEYKK